METLTAPALMSDKSSLWLAPAKAFHRLSKLPKTSDGSGKRMFRSPLELERNVAGERNSRRNLVSVPAFLRNWLKVA